MSRFDSTEIQGDKATFDIDYSFLLYAAATVIFGGLSLFAVYTATVLIHELTHLTVARKLGYRTARIRLYVFGAVLYGDFDEVEPTDEIKIALSAPIVNLASALVGTSVWWLFPEAYEYTEAFVAVSLTLGTVNLLPCYPLDGGRILCALLSKRIKRTKAVRIVKTVGTVFGCAMFILFAVGVFFGFFAYSVGIFGLLLTIGGLMRTQKDVYEKVSLVKQYEKRLAHGADVKTVAVSGDMTLGSAYLKCRGFGIVEMHVYVNNRVVGTVTGAEAEELLVRFGHENTMKEIVLLKNKA